MLSLDTLFPARQPDHSATLEAAPKSLLAVQAAIDYKEALSVGDARYVPTTEARAEKFKQRFFATFGYKKATGEFAPPVHGKHVLFFGHVGCGKSTELAQMCAELNHRDRYWVIQVNLLELIDPNDVRYSDVWLAVAQELVKRLQEDHVQVDPVVLQRFERWFKEQVLTNEQVKDFAAEIKTEAEASVGVPFVYKLLGRFTAAMRTGSTHRETLRTVVRNTFGEFVGALNQLITNLTDSVKRSGKGQQILIVIDGTDRFRGDDWKRFFVEDANQLALVKCIAVYTAPMALKSSGSRLDLFECLVLPMIKLREFSATGEGAVRPEAYEAMRSVLLKRCHYSLFDNQATLDALIDYSGGHLRDALRLLSYACVEALEAQLDGAAVEAAARRLAGDYRDWLATGDYALLVQADRQRENLGTSDAIARLVEGGALLEYNTGSWRMPHPVVKLLRGFQDAQATAQA